MGRFDIRQFVSAMGRIVRQHPALCSALMVLVLYWPVLTSGYLMDDFMHLRVFGLDAANMPRDHLGALTLFDFSSGDAGPGMPWWASQGIQTRFWRPLSSLLGYADHLIAPHQPVWAHLHSLLWLLACVAGLRFMLRETCDQGQAHISWVALLTLLIFSTTCTLALPTLWIANRSALIATSLCWFSIGLHAQGQRSFSRLRDLASAFALGAALLAGEIAWVGVIQLGCFVIWGDTRPWKQQIARLWPHLLVIATWTSMYVLHDYGAHGGGYYLHPISDFWLFLKDGPARLSQLSLFALAFVPTELSQSESLKNAMAIAGAVLLGLAIWCASRIMAACSPNHQRGLRWMGMAGVLGTLPILGAQPNDRLLVPIMLSTSFFFATLIRYLAQRRKNRVFLVLAGLGVLRHLVLAPCLTLIVNWSLAQKSQDGQEANAVIAAKLIEDPGSDLSFILNSPGPAIAWSFDEHLAFLQKDGSPHKWRFAAATRSDLELSRDSASSLVLGTQDGRSLTNGLFGKLLRTQLDNARDPLRVGKVIDRQDFVVEILDLDLDKQPTRVRFIFPSEQALESTRFYNWDGQTLQAVTLPDIGELQKYAWKIGPMHI